MHLDRAGRTMTERSAWWRWSPHDVRRTAHLHRTAATLDRVEARRGARRVHGLHLPGGPARRDPPHPAGDEHPVPLQGHPGLGREAPHRAPSVVRIAMAYRRKKSEYYWISYVNHLGKRVRESTGTTKKAKAEMIERARRDQFAFRRRGMVDPEIGTATTFGELIDFWWKNYGTRLKSPTIKGSIEKHLRPALGDLPLSSFTGLALEQLLQSKETELKPRTRNHLRAVVRRMFRVATRAGLWVGANPIDEVSIAEV